MRSNRQNGQLQEKYLPYSILFIVILFNLFYLSPELTIPIPFVNDGVLHHLVFEETINTLALGNNPTDFWLRDIDLGYPLLHHYQQLGYVLPAIVFIPLQNIISSRFLFDLIRYFLLSLFPLSVYWSMRRMGFSSLQAALAGFVGSFLSTNGLYGWDDSSYVWRGYGMYTQLWGMFLLPIAVACGNYALRRGRGFFAAVLTISMTLLSHLVYGYITLLTLFVISLAPILGAVDEGDEEHGAAKWQWKRLLLIYAFVFIVTAYFTVPFVLDRLYLNRSIWEYSGKYDSYGYAWVLNALIKGELFDFGHFPLVTVFLLIGLVVSIFRWGQSKYRLPVLIFPTCYFRSGS